MVTTKIPLLKEERIQYDGFYDLGELYKHAHDWLEWRKFDIEEKKYKEKLKGDKKDLEIQWSVTRDYDEYSKIELEVKWILIAMAEVEVEKDGKKSKMNKGEINIFVSAYLILDKDDKWEATPFWKFLKHFYERYLYKSTIDVLKGEVWKTGWNFYNEIKSFLQLYRY